MFSVTALPGYPGVAVSQKRRDEEHRQPRDSLTALSPILEHNVVCVLMLVQRPIMTCYVDHHIVNCVMYSSVCAMSVLCLSVHRPSPGNWLALSSHATQHTPIIIIIVIYYTQYCVSTAYLLQQLPLHTYNVLFSVQRAHRRMQLVEDIHLLMILIIIIIIILYHNF